MTITGQVVGEHSLAELDPREICKRLEMIGQVATIGDSIVAKAWKEKSIGDTPVIDYQPLLLEYQAGIRGDLVTLARNHPEAFEAQLPECINEALRLACSNRLILVELYKRAIINQADIDTILAESLISRQGAIVLELLKRRMVDLDKLRYQLVMLRKSGVTNLITRDDLLRVDPLFRAEIIPSN